MAKRNRVPGRKSLGAGRRSRNKNPKLSPFQRELKRNRLANQPPTLASAVHRDYPASQRRIYEYLQKREEREAARREARKRQREEEAAAASQGDGAGGVGAVLPPTPSAAPTPAVVPSPAAASGKVQRKARPADLPSLNDDAKARAAPLEDRVDVRRLAKKEKKHAKRLLQRKQRIAESMQNLESEFSQSLARRRGGKRGDDVREKDKQFERERRKMERENKNNNKSSESSEAPKKRRLENPLDASAAAPQCAVVTVIENEESPSTAAAATSKRSRKRRQADDPATAPPKRDFYDYVDVVRFGERVEAPPVFDVVPTASSSLGKLAAKLGAAMALGEERGKRRGSTTATRQGLLSGSTTGVAGASSYAERRRLASLGLTPRIHETIDTTGGGAPLSSSPSAAGHSRPRAPPSSTSDEFALLRQKVMESYQRNKVLRHQASKPRGGGGSINLKHQFPLI